MKAPLRLALLAALTGLCVAGLAPRSAAQDLPDVVDDPGLEATTRPDPEGVATGWGCTLRTLVSGGECVFEGSAPSPKSRAQQKKANASAVERLAPGLCAEVSRARPKEEPSKDLVALCKADVKKVLPSCELDGVAAVLDAKKRFTAEARPCYFALGDVLRNTARIAATGLGCCRCALEKGCTANAHTCLRFLGEDPPVLPECAPSACYEPCSHLLPHASAVKQPRPKADAGEEEEEEQEPPPHRHRSTYRTPAPFPAEAPEEADPPPPRRMGP